MAFSTQLYCPIRRDYGIPSFLTGQFQNKMGYLLVRDCSTRGVCWGANSQGGVIAGCATSVAHLRIMNCEPARVVLFHPVYAPLSCKTRTVFSRLSYSRLSLKISEWPRHIATKHTNNTTVQCNKRSCTMIFSQPQSRGI
jgi:hypothetical protein